tara:strand:+ start:5050 stop:5700 length:651 start_codon:yes stop_codon:yes gene_type:complete
MNSKQKIAIFDFCDTIFNGQSFNYFINYLIDNQPFYNKFYLKLRKTLTPFISKNNLSRKEFLLRPYRGKSQQFFIEQGESFFNEIIKKRLYPELISLINEHQKRGDTVVLVSGGLSIYLSFFAKEYNIKHELATNLKFDNGLFTGKVEGNECLGEEKVLRLKDEINLELYDLNNAIVYTDHKSDLPLLNIVGKGVIIRNHQDVSWKDDKHTIIEVG